MSKATVETKELPLVSIGVPIFNEGAFIRESLDALISQDYANVEIIISDNASTDETSAICKEFQRRFPEKITYSRFDTNTGASNNFKKVLEASNGRYFMWAGGHDLWSENYISECVALLELNPKAAVAFGCCEWIDESGNPYERSSGWADTRGLDPVARYFTVLWGNMHPILGLIRKQFLDPAAVQSMVGTDLIILCQLAMKGDFVHAAKTQWKRREYRVELNYAQKLERYKSQQYGLAKSVFDRIFPLAKLPLKLLKDICRSQLEIQLKLAILFLVMPTFAVKYILGKRSRK